MLEARIGVDLDRFGLDVELTVDDGEVVALLGPNGAGKSTALRAIAGLRPLDRGSIVLDDVAIDGLPTEERPIGVVFQDLLLFPRMTALDNVAFGLRARGSSKADARRDAQAWLDRFDVGHRAASKSKALSGGEAQRVALARALATSPRLLLLDEPLAALDATTRVLVRAELRRHLATFDGGRLLVTHDPVDAVVLADRLVIIEEGRVVQSGTPAAVTAHPATRYVAELAGVNLLHGVAAGERRVRLADGVHATTADALPGNDVAITVRPQAITLHRHEP
ncbi:MAG TPA: ABC transporter ATP-binding protein, partial [Acidimicrobiales bacterium]|nr:ABC transporter ATP-binding protein [Acidimicrobiales bacterium]